MAIRAGLGIGFSVHPQLAGNLAALRALEENPEPEVAVFVMDVTLDAGQVTSGIRAALGDVPLFGTTTQAEISSLGKTQGTVVLLLLSVDDVRFDLLSAASQEDPVACGRAMAEAVRGRIEDWERPYTAVMFATEHDGGGARQLRALTESLPRPLPISGGGSVGPPDGAANTVGASQIVGSEVRQREYAMLLAQALRPDAVRFGYGYESCWTPIAPPVQVTRSDGHLVFEVDDRPVMEYLRCYLGDDFQEALAETAWKYTFLAKLQDERTTRKVVRTPNWTVVEDGVRFFPREDMEGMELQLVQVSRSELLEGARRAATMARDALDGARPRAALLFSCQLRKKFLHSRGDDEVAAVREVLGDDVPILGFYAAGEYGPPYCRWEDVTDPSLGLSGSRQLSTSASLLVLGDPGGEDPGGVDWPARLRRWMHEDHHREFPEDATQRLLERTRAQLQEAEAMVDETEQAFKHINTEHYTLATELQDKMRELARANRRNERLQTILRRYTPHTVWRKAGRTVDAGFFDIPDEELTSTFMFMDVKGFTAFAEDHPPEEVIRELNAIFEPSTAIIYDHGGDIDKFIGDCIFATFDTPAGAVDAGFEIHTVVRQRIQQGAPFAVRIGVHTGRVISGNVGGAVRRDNTLIGDAVNLAQRLESACTPGAMLLSRDTFEAVRDALPPDVVLERRQVQAKGKREPVQAYEVRLED